MTKNQKKERYYSLTYWQGATKINLKAPFKNEEEAAKYIYEQGCLPISVNFIGWR